MSDDTEVRTTTKIISQAEQDFIDHYESKRIEWVTKLQDAVDAKDVFNLYWLLTEINTFYTIYGKQAPSAQVVQTELLIGIRDFAKSAGANPVLQALRRMGKPK